MRENMWGEIDVNSFCPFADLRHIAVMMESDARETHEKVLVLWRRDGTGRPRNTGRLHTRA